MTDVVSTMAPIQAAPSQAPALIPSTDQPNTSGNHPHFSRNLLIALVGVAVLLAIGLFVVSKITPKPKTAALPPDELLATVGDQKIYTSTVEAAAKEQYAPAAITNSVLKTFYGRIVEYSILDIWAHDKNITVNNDDIKEELKKEGINKDLTQLTQAYIKNIKYRILKDRLLASNTKSRKAFVISMWVSPYSYPQKADYEEKRTQAKQAAALAASLLREGKTPLTVAKTLFNQYPLLQQTLGLNGYQMRYLKDESLVVAPKLYLFDKNFTEDPLQQQLFLLNNGEIKDFTKDDGSGSFVIKVVDSNDSNTDDYDVWLKGERAKLVKEYKDL